MADRGLVTVAVVHEHEIATSFWQSFEGLRQFDTVSAGVLLHANGLLMLKYGTDGIVGARNKGVQQFLQGDAEWLLWIDSDMGFAPDALYRLLLQADPTERPVVGGLCFASREVTSDGLGGYRTVPRPTIFDWRDVDGVMKFAGRIEYPVSTLTRCDGTGSAFLLVHRSVYERIDALNVAKGRPTGRWYDRIPGTDGELLGEDISFCARAGELQIPIHVDTAVKTNHLKPQWVSELQFWRTLPVPPATEPTAVIVPVMRRPRRAEPFMRSLTASSGLVHAYAVAEHDDVDTIAAWEAAGATVLTGDAVSFAAKVNAAHHKTSEPWMLLVGDDVKFHPGWLDHAQHIARTFQASVVGTNDLGNPQVLAGEHATHPLISRAYVDAMGASWDGPGVVAHEGYRHWYVDNEIVTAAKQRGVWAMAMGSIVEHLHPLFGKGDQDDVYQLGQSSVEQDGEVFKQRCAQFL